MALQVLTAVEAVVEEAAEDGVVGVIGAKAEEALTYVAGWELAELVPESAGGASAIGHGDDGGEVRRMVLQTVEDYEVAGASADDNDPGGVGVRGVGHSGWDDKGVGQRGAMASGQTG